MTVIKIITAKKNIGKTCFIGYWSQEMGVEGGLRGRTSKDHSQQGLADTDWSIAQFRLYINLL